ncbi:MAG TPA: hypothetical protein VIL50_04205, partial [Candidatus Limnocylindrales bacterium]
SATRRPGPRIGWPFVVTGRARACRQESPRIIPGPASHFGATGPERSGLRLTFRAARRRCGALSNERP